MAQLFQQVFLFVYLCLPCSQLHCAHVISKSHAVWFHHSAFYVQVLVEEFHPFSETLLREFMKTFLTCPVCFLPFVQFFRIITTLPSQTITNRAAKISCHFCQPSNFFRVGFNLLAQLLAVKQET